MKTALTIFTAAVLGVLAGCAPGEKEPLKEEKEPLKEEKELLTVDFQEAQTLRYKFVSSRDIDVDWDPGKSEPDKNAADKFSETMDMVVAYTPVEVNPYGLTTIKATCESVKVQRSKGRRKDAVESLPGKTFTFTIDPTGKIEDYSQLNDLIREIGKKAFRQDTARGRIKEPDMIGDFIAAQWFLWDPVSSIEKASKGISVGQTWKSKLPIPTPMVTRKARDVTYSLDEIRESEKGRLAVIRSSYSPAESVPGDWPPMPYSGSFQMSGTFGFLRGYKILSLKGQGVELFNMNAGRTERYSQQYQTQWEASLPFGLKGSANPRITIKQNLSMQLLK
ncbi:hypothetical protein ES703_67890 [subsurface metagenome]